jgi:hypothetical protein
MGKTLPYLCATASPFMRRQMSRVDVATFWFPPGISLSSALFCGAAVARCMLVSVLGAAICVSNSLREASACFRSSARIAVARQDMGKTRKPLSDFDKNLLISL